MPSGSRRTHTKSRNGCGQCKRRKIKCDERGPRCSNCCKREEQCDYELFEHPTSSPRRKRSKNPLSDQSSDRIIKYPSPLPSLPSMNLTHLELMHHYLTNTSLTLHEFRESGKRWEVIVPAQALSHEFLMHALLGVSALHIVQLRGMSKSTSRYLACARAHHNEAVTLFRSTVTEITPTNCTAAVAFSHLLLIFSSGIAQISDALHHHDNIDSLITVLASFRSYWKLSPPCSSG
ncbi:hypothetical protein B0J14DRAFT_685900 [Halenospora varia]|nr:hypothetical protein B0J14DRAFT_685900 [Halenospora varia]